MADTSTLQFKVTNERMSALPLDLAIALEDLQLGENPTLRTMRDLFAHFLVGVEGRDLTEHIGMYLPATLAKARLGEFTVSELADLGKLFVDAVKDGVLPPAKGG